MQPRPDSRPPPPRSGTINYVSGGGLLQLKLADIIAMAETRDGSTGTTLDEVRALSLGCSEGAARSKKGMREARAESRDDD